jgi:glycogen debranching enzyme
MAVGLLPSRISSFRLTSSEGGEGRQTSHWIHSDIDAFQERTDTVHHLINALLRCRSHIRTDQWRGLPELTNKDAEHCRDSCPTQAWSASTLLDFLDDVRKVGK